MFKKTFGIGIVLCLALLCTLPAFAAEPTAALVEGDIEVTNNVGPDTVLVDSNVADTDIIKVYAVATGGSPIAVAQSSGTSVTLYINQIGKAGGKVYVTKTSTGSTESTRTAITVAAEALATAPAEGNITVTNNITGILDTVAITGAGNGAYVKIYASATATAPIAVGLADSSGAATIYIDQLGVKAGTIYVTATGAALESTRTPKAFLAEAATAALTVDQITVTNNVVGTPDTVAITGLTEDGTVKVYSAATGGILLGSFDVVSTGEPIVQETTATVTIPQIGTGIGKVYVTYTAVSGENESARTAASYTAEKSVAVAAASITVTNNYAGTNDTIAVTGIKSGDVVKVYATSSAAEPLVSGTASSTSLTLSYSQVGIKAGKVYVSITSPNKAESSRIGVSYIAETTTATPAANTITVTNNYSKSDTIVVTGLVVGDVVKVYSTATGTEALATSAAVASGTSATISLTLPTAGAGKVYVTVTNTGNTHESARTAMSYTSETSAAPAASNILVLNNTGTDDSIYIAGLKTGDVVKVYDAAKDGNLLVTSSAVGTGATGTTITLANLPVGGKIYITVTSTDKAESLRVLKTYTVLA